MPRSQLLSAPVVKTGRRRRLVAVKHRVVFGSLEAVKPILAPPLGCHLNTSFVERITRAIRPQVAAVGRRVSTLCKGAEGWRQQRALCHVSHHVVLPPVSLRQPQLEPTNGTGSATRWQPCTPTRAAGLTDPVWPRRKVLLFRVPPWAQPVEG
jgi:hypothetical protein